MIQNSWSIKYFLFRIGIETIPLFLHYGNPKSNKKTFYSEL